LLHEARSALAKQERAQNSEALNRAPPPIASLAGSVR
jgi:hypothetical protein